MFSPIRRSSLYLALWRFDIVVSNMLCAEEFRRFPGRTIWVSRQARYHMRPPLHRGAGSIAKARGETARPRKASRKTDARQWGRKRRVEGKGVSVRVGLGGGRSIKKKK